MRKCTLRLRHKLASERTVLDSLSLNALDVSSSCFYISVGSLSEFATSIPTSPIRSAGHIHRNLDPKLQR